jgi:hypothetical protein
MTTALFGDLHYVNDRQQQSLFSGGWLGGAPDEIPPSDVLIDRRGAELQTHLDREGVQFPWLKPQFSTMRII